MVQSSFIQRLLRSDLLKYFSFGVLAKLIPFGAAIVFAYLMSARDFGVAGVFISSVAITASFLNFGSAQIIVREKYFLSKKEFSTLIVSGRVLSLILLFILCVIFFGYSSIASFDFIETKWVGLALFVAFFQGGSDVLKKILIVNRHAKVFGVVDNLTITLTAVLSFVMMYTFYGRGYEGRIVGYSLGAVFSLFIGMYAVRSLASLIKPTVSSILKVFFYGLRVFPQVVSGWIKMGADKLVLVTVLTFDEIGIYSFLVMLASTVMIFGGALNNDFVSKSMEYYRGSEVGKLRSLRVKYMLLGGVITVVLSVMANIFSLSGYWPEGYEVSISSIYFIFISFYFQLVYLLYAKLFIFLDKMAMLGWSNIVLVLVYLLFIFIPWYEKNIEIVAFILFAYNFLLALWVAAYVRVKEASSFDHVVV